MDLHKINKIRTVEGYNSNSQYKLNTNTKRTLENQKSLEIRFADEVKATPRTTTRVKSKSNFGIEEIDRTEVSKDSGFVQLVFDDGSKTNETPLSQHSPILGRKVKRARKSKQQFNVYQTEEESCQDAENFCENEIEREKCANNLNSREKPLEEGTNINNENKSLVGNIESFDIDNFVAKLTPRDVLEILEENHSLTTQLRLDRKINKNRLSLKRKRNESDKSVIQNEESSKVSGKILTDKQIEMPLIKRRRELYSAKDTDSTKADICVTETEENTRNSTFVERKDVQVNLRTDAKPYQERKSPSRKSFVIDSFDKLNAVVDIDPKIVLVDVKPVNKTDVYDFTSSAETDKEIEKKKVVTRTVKRVNKSDVYEVTSNAEAHKNFEKKKIVTRNIKPVNKTDVYEVTSSAEADKDFKMKKIVTRTKNKTLRPRSKVSKRTRRSKSKMKTKMVDEWMRKADPFYLNSSIVPELCDQETVTEIEPMHNKPRVDMLPECIDSEKETTPAKKILKWNKKRSEERKGKQDDHISSEISLPELEIETISAFIKPSHSILESDKLENTRNDHLHKSDLILNLPHVSEQVNDNSTVTKVNIALNWSQRTSSDISRKELHDVLDELDEKSISTTGASPITAHGVNEESPPNIDDISRTISPRSLEAEGLSEKAREYYHQLLKDMVPSSEQHRRSKPCEKPKNDKSLCLSVTRLPLSELRSYSREPHEVKKADPSARPYSNRQGTLSDLSEAENLNPSNGESITCKSITKPITQVKENADFKLRNTDCLASKSLTFERVKENHQSTSQPRQDGSTEHRSVASSINDWVQKKEDTKLRTAEDKNELIDKIIDKIESTLAEIQKNTNRRLVQLVEALIAEFKDRAGAILRRAEQASAAGTRQMMQAIEALKPATRDL